MTMFMGVSVLFLNSLIVSFVLYQSLTASVKKFEITRRAMTLYATLYPFVYQFIALYWEKGTCKIPYDLHDDDVT